MIVIVASSASAKMAATISFADMRRLLNIDLLHDEQQRRNNGKNIIIFLLINDVWSHYIQ